MAGWENLSTLGKIGAVGGAINPYVPLLSLGANVLGGLFDNSAEEEAKQRQAELAEQQRQFNERMALEKQNQQLAQQQFGLQEKTAGQQSALSGLGMLANQRLQANQLQRFRTALNRAAGGANG